jgi:hypothetical protein
VRVNVGIHWGATLMVGQVATRPSFDSLSRPRRPVASGVPFARWPLASASGPPTTGFGAGRGGSAQDGHRFPRKAGAPDVTPASA